MDIKLLDVLACPICKGKLDYEKSTKRLICQYDKLAYPIRDGIPILIENEAEKI